MLALYYRYGIISLSGQHKPTALARGFLARYRIIIMSDFIKNEHRAITISANRDEVSGVKASFDVRYERPMKGEFNAFEVNELHVMYMPDYHYEDYPMSDNERLHVTKCLKDYLLNLMYDREVA